MSQAVPMREIAHHIADYVRRVEEGETIPVTKNGRLVALLVPPNESELLLDHLVAEGLVDPQHRGARGLLDGLLSVPVEQRVQGSLSDTVVAMRDEEQH
jgi:prevent-host-death family protein